MTAAEPAHVPARSFVTHLECARCGAHADATKLANLCPIDGGPYLVRYDLERLQGVPRSMLAGRQASLWRYRELLPLDDPNNAVTLGEGNTPIIEPFALREQLKLARSRRAARPWA